MANVAPKARKHLSADALFRLVHTGFDHIPDYRPADVDITLSDVLMSAFAMFSLKAPSLLAFDKERAEGNLHTIYGIQRVPCDTYMREILDLVSPSGSARSLRVSFGNCNAARRLKRDVPGWPLSLGPGWHRVFFVQDDSQLCLHRVPQRVYHLYTHQMLGAAIIHPDQRAVMPLMPAPIVNRDGTRMIANVRPPSALWPSCARIIPT